MSTKVVNAEKAKKAEKKPKRVVRSRKRTPVDTPLPPPAVVTDADTDGMTDRQRAFIEHYLICLNATESARRAGYIGDANTVGPRLLANPAIRRIVDARMAEMKLTADEVLRRLSDHATSSMGDFIRVNDDGSAVLDLAKAKAEDKLHLIKKLKTTTRTIRHQDDEPEVVITTEIELHDPQAALVNVGRHHKLFTDKVEDDRVRALMEKLNAIRAQRAALTGAGSGNPA